MSARYWVWVDNEIFDDVKRGIDRVDGVRIDEYRRDVTMTQVLFADENAPAELEGRDVTPEFRVQYVGSEVARIWISAYSVDSAQRSAEGAHINEGDSR